MATCAGLGTVAAGALGLLVWAVCRTIGKVSARDPTRTPAGSGTEVAVRPRPLPSADRSGRSIMRRVRGGAFTLASIGAVIAGFIALSPEDGRFGEVPNTCELITHDRLDAWVPSAEPSSMNQSTDDSLVCRWSSDWEHLNEIGSTAPPGDLFLETRRAGAGVGDSGPQIAHERLDALSPDDMAWLPVSNLGDEAMRYCDSYSSGDSRAGSCEIAFRISNVTVHVSYTSDRPPEAVDDVTREIAALAESHLDEL